MKKNNTMSKYRIEKVPFKSNKFPDLPWVVVGPKGVIDALPFYLEAVELKTALDDSEKDNV